MYALCISLAYIHGVSNPLAPGPTHLTRRPNSRIVLVSGFLLALSIRQRHNEECISIASHSVDGSVLTQMSKDLA